MTKPENATIQAYYVNGIKHPVINHPDNVNNLETSLKEMVSSFFITRARNLFINHPEIKSFGWEQFTSQGGTFERKFGVYSTRDTPAVNGDEQTWSAEAQPVVEFLSVFKTELLLLAFGNDCKVTVRSDLTIEIIDDY